MSRRLGGKGSPSTFHQSLVDSEFGHMWNRPPRKTHVIEQNTYSPSSPLVGEVEAAPRPPLPVVHLIQYKQACVAGCVLLCMLFWFSIGIYREYSCNIKPASR